MKALLLFLVLLVAAPLLQAQHRPDLTPGQAYDLRNQDDRRPRWCQMYDRRDYYRELRACGEDRRCRWEARRKAERCGLR